MKTKTQGRLSYPAFPLPVLWHEYVKIIFHKFQFPFMAAEQRRKFVIEPKGVNEKVIGFSDFLLRGVQVLSAVRGNGNIGADGMNQIRFVFDVGINQRISEARTVFPVGIASAGTGLIKTLGKFQSCPVGFR